MYVILDSVEEAVPEMLLDLKIHHSPRALPSDLVEGSFQPHGERGDLLIVALCNFIKVLHKDI